LAARRLEYAHVSFDTIAVRGIRAYGKHGANPGERDFVQAFDIDLELEVDLTAARASDELADTLDYAALHGSILRAVRERSYRLLERLGDDILTEILRDERIASARLTIAKPRLLGGATPAVTLRARRGAAGS
jgi:dihydroneopterin aldolase